ncbi:MAG: homocysteine S-methyltransferase family protein [Deltaproteobacteria bacterium]|nr:homocysteine S-methyltransferase family protein [Deltaproteobacteria bacterium]
MRPHFEDALNRGMLIFDGAMGTMLMAAGSVTGTCGEELNMSAPDVVREVHNAYVAAGADVVETNSFGGSRIKLEKSHLGHLTREINLAAAKIAREAAGEDVFVAGSVGPLGEFLEPLGRLSSQEAVDAFKEQSLALAEGGVDMIIIETMSDLQEVHAAVQGVREGPDLPVVATMTFEKRLHTVMGVSPARAALSLGEWGVSVMGSNCGTGPEEMLAVISQMKEASPEGRFLVQPNAGRPRLTAGGEVVYDMTSARFAEYAVQFVELGVNIVGGCCGTTPEYIRAIVQELR